MTAAGRARVLVLGAGGNIGSHLVPHLARTPEIGQLTLVDRDRYEPRNLTNQDIPPGAVGRPKASVQAARARRLRPDLEVEALVIDVEQLPLGRFRADLILACLDSRRARQLVSRAACRLGVSWLDSGVLADGMLARVSHFHPGLGSPCLECAWDDADYAAVEQVYPCAGDSRTVPPRTAAPASLGALAATLQAIECRKLLTGEGISLDPGTELVVDANHQRHLLTRSPRNPRCRLASHGAWAITPLPSALGQTLAWLFAEVEAQGNPATELALTMEGHRFARTLSCAGCGLTRRVLRLASRRRASDRRCSTCGGALLLHGFGLTERVEQVGLSRREMNRSLRGIGFQPGDVLSIGSHAAQWHVELES